MLGAWSQRLTEENVIQLFFQTNAHECRNAWHEWNVSAQNTRPAMVNIISHFCLTPRGCGVRMIIAFKSFSKAYQRAFGASVQWNETVEPPWNLWSVIVIAKVCKAKVEPSTKEGKTQNVSTSHQPLIRNLCSFFFTKTATPPWRKIMTIFLFAFWPARYNHSVCVCVFASEGVPFCVYFSQSSSSVPPLWGPMARDGGAFNGHKLDRNKSGMVWWETKSAKRWKSLPLLHPSGSSFGPIVT